MDYLPRGAEQRRDSSLAFPGAATAIVVGLDYGGGSRMAPLRVTRVATTTMR